ncbi:iron transporter [Larsenimonas suaedae]|uniref:Iron transporter n=1 Tax=Larsenimonas suaedae TaxID=1851019 RepID=A0ABU1GS87_9GAMM|nr:iron transporter [Larsenimonas suaedae]MCM2972355.1 iron transporter [Larsenimonas suaedae]MDR5894849.1 iron transporter [Larsenimonas suaedae]
MISRHTLWALPALTLISTSALALEYPIGKPKHEHGMEIAAVYLQPVTMEPAGKLPAKDADIHLEADIHALEDNTNGFEPGSWIPALSVHYRLTKNGSDTPIEGDFMPMVASDGPHYGANVKLDGPGKYHLTFTIKHPDMQRHVDKETGVSAWYEPLTVDYDFTYAGVGKKGGY